MTIDEVIAEMTNNADRFKKLSEDYGDSFRHMEVLSDLENAVFYEKQEAKYRQIAAWLEELKELRSTSCGFTKEDIELNRTAMYNKAIDDFAERLATYLGVENATKYGNKNAEQQRNSYDTLMKYEVADAIDDVAEQLKAGN